MNAKRFEEAVQTCRIADAVAAAEVKENCFQLGSAYYRSKQLLDAKHAAEVDTLNKAGDVRRGELKFMKEAWERRFANRDSALEFELENAQDPDKLWVLKHRNDGDQIVNATGALRPIKRFTKPVNVTEFNVLPLPVLPSLGGGRPRVKKPEKPRASALAQ
jgi:hypothetical protein